MEVDEGRVVRPVQPHVQREHDRDSFAVGERARQEVAGALGAATSPARLSFTRRNVSLGVLTEGAWDDSAGARFGVDRIGLHTGACRVVADRYRRGNRCRPPGSCRRGEIPFRLQSNVSRHMQPIGRSPHQPRRAAARRCLSLSCGLSLVIAAFIWSNYRTILLTRPTVDVAAVLRDVQIVNVAAGVAAVALIFFAASQALPPWAALGTALLTSISPHLVSFTVYVLTEPIAAMLTCALLAAAAVVALKRETAPAGVRLSALGSSSACWRCSGRYTSSLPRSSSLPFQGNVAGARHSSAP